MTTALMPSWLEVTNEHIHAVLHSGNGPVALFVHGALGSRSYWNDNLAALQQVCQPVVVELWGHGRSPSPDDPTRYEPSGYVDEFERIRQELGAPNIWLIGQSMGAALVMHYAVALPHRVAGMIITNSASGFADPIEWQERNRTMVSKIADQVDEEFSEHSARGISLSFRITNFALPLGNSLQEISAPVLFTNGIEEQRFQKHLPRVKLIPQVEVVELPASHAVNAHDPKGWNRAAADFISKHANPGV